MKRKRAVINLLILIFPGGTTTVCTGGEFLKILVPRLAKIGFPIHFLLKFVAKPNKFLSLNIRKTIAFRCIMDASTKNAVMGYP